MLAGSPRRVSRPRLARSARACLVVAALIASGCTVRSSPTQAFRPAPPQAAARPPMRPAPPPLPPRPPDDQDAPRADPGAAQLFLAALARPSAPIAQTSRPPRVTALALENTARGEAGGMTLTGAPQVAMLREGEQAATAVTVAPGECVTFIAHGGLGVVEVDLFLTTGGGAQVAILAEDPNTGPIAVIGGRRGCFTNNGTTPLAATVHASARRGSGVVIIQSYRR